MISTGFPEDEPGKSDDEREREALTKWDWVKQTPGFDWFDLLCGPRGGSISDILDELDRELGDPKTATP